MIYLQNFVRYITKRKLTENALRESEIRLAKTAKMAKIGYWVWDEIEDKAIYCSDEVAEICGFAMGRELTAVLSSSDKDIELVHPAERDRFAEVMRQSKAEKTGYDIEYRIVRPDGQIRHLREIMEPVLDEQGNFIRSNGIAQDITEHKRAEQELIENYEHLQEAQLRIEEQNQELMDLAGEYEEAKNIAVEAKNIALAANRTKSEFLANMSHELRTPLNAVIGFSEVMMNGTNGQLSDKHKEYANDIFVSGHHLLTLINDILDLSKIEAGKIEVYPKNVSISSIFKACIGFIAERAQEKLINVEVKTSCDDLHVYADPLRLKQIILNLLSNSVKFTDINGSIDIRCAVGDNVIISVEDNGMGMDKEGLKSALTKFGQVNSGLNREQEGTGLGLPLSIELAELMGGSIDVTSELGVGTTVTVTLPKAR